MANNRTLYIAQFLMPIALQLGHSTCPELYNHSVNIYSSSLTLGLVRGPPGGKVRNYEALKSRAANIGRPGLLNSKMS